MGGAVKQWDPKSLASSLICPPCSCLCLHHLLLLTLVSSLFLMFILSVMQKLNSFYLNVFDHVLQQLWIWWFGQLLPLNRTVRNMNSMSSAYIVSLQVNRNIDGNKNVSSHNSHWIVSISKKSFPKVLNEMSIIIIKTQPQDLKHCRMIN